MATHASRDTTTGALFELKVSGHAPGIPLHKKELGKYYTQQTGKYYSLSLIRANKAKGIPADKNEKAKMFEGQYLFARALEPDEAYLDEATSTLTIFEKKFQDTDGSADEKIQGCDFKIKQYQKLAKELNIEHVYFIYILGDWFKSPYYADVLRHVKETPNCDYFFANDIQEDI